MIVCGNHGRILLEIISGDFMSVKRYAWNDFNLFSLPREFFAVIVYVAQPVANRLVSPLVIIKVVLAIVIKLVGVKIIAVVWKQ